MTPEGSHHQSTAANAAGNPGTDYVCGSVARTQDLRGTADEYGYNWTAPQRGRYGIQVTDTNGNHVATLPGVAGRYHRGDGLVYLLDCEWGLFHAPATDIRRGDAWDKIGRHDAAEWNRSEQGRMFSRIWYAVADDGPSIPPSPRVTRALPPLAPALAPLTEDPENAARAWAEVGSRMTPAARLCVGLALMSPWTEEIGCTSSVLSLWGAAGEGKSVLARIVAALFGSPEDNEGLFGTFNASGQGIPAHAQDLSYFPVILDEANSSTADPEPILTALVMGAQRKRASRSGASVATAARWGGLVVTTGNTPLDLRHEMFSRRLLEVEACDLWDPERPAPRTEQAEEWWASITDALDDMAGWPWVEVCRMFTPGTPAAATVRDYLKGIPFIPGESNLSRLCRLGMLGCQVLTDWTGFDWETGTFDAAARMLAERAEAALDPARDAAREIQDHMARNPADWEPSADRPGRDLAGWSATDMDGHVCSIPHEDRDTCCVWYNVVSTAFGNIVSVSPRRLANTRFTRAVYAPESVGLTRKVRTPGAGSTKRTRAITVCVHALDVLGDGPAAAILAATPTERQRRPLPEPEPLPLPTDAPEVDERPRGWTHTEDPDLTAALNLAAQLDDITDLVGPMTWLPQKATGWNAGGWRGEGSGSGVMTRDSDGRTVRVWRVPNGRTAPEDYAAALQEFMTTTGIEFRSIPSMAQRLVIDHKGQNIREPRWQLPKEQADLWTPGAIMHARQWGDRKATGDQYDRTRSYLPAIAQANLAPLHVGEEFTRYGSDAPVDRKHAGMYRITVPEWTSPLPAPHGSTMPGSTVWTSAEIMRLYAETDTPVEIIEAHLAPVHSIPHLDAFAERVKTWLSEFDGPARMVPKLAYQALAGAMTSEHNRGRRGRIYRPDWGNAIADCSWANVLRRVYAVHAADSRFVPVRVNVDAIYYPPGLPEPPGLPLGDRLGSFRKVEG